jgi:hypothetical protein
MKLDSFPRGTGHLHPSCLALHPFLPSYLPIPLLSNVVPMLPQANSCWDSKGEQELEKKAVIIVSLEVA